MSSTPPRPPRMPSIPAQFYQMILDILHQPITTEIIPSFRELITHIANFMGISEDFVRDLFERQLERYHNPSQVREYMRVFDFIRNYGSVTQVEDLVMKRKRGGSGRGLKKKSPNKWVQFVKDYCHKHKISYRDAIKSPKVKEEYHKSK